MVRIKDNHEMISHDRRPIVRIGNDPDKIQILPILECGEQIVEVENESGIFVYPQYHARGIRSASNQLFVRESVLKGLRVASKKLPKGVNLLLWDGLRTLETQAELYEKTKLIFSAEHRNESVELYLAEPSVSKDSFYDFPPPHATGGAIDLTLCNSSGTPLDMGAEFDEFREIAWLAYFEEDRTSAHGEHALEYRARRRILYWAMIAAGFAPYPWEYWHYELGTTVAATFHGLPNAKYGAVVPWRDS